MNHPVGESANRGLREEILAAQNMRPFPVTPQQLLQELRRPEPDIDQVIQLIECDPSVAAKILSMANGPLYGMTRPVTSVGHSIVCPWDAKRRTAGDRSIDWGVVSRW